MTAPKRKTTKRRRGEFYIALAFWELESPAFAHLTADATRVYLFMRKRLNFDNGNNGAVLYSHRDATKDLRAGGWQRGSNALAELQHFGFIKLRNGGQPGASIRLACEWQLTAFPCGGQEASKDFMRWQGDVFEPPYRSKLGARTRVKREQAENQLPIGNTPTPRRQHADAYPPSAAPNGPENVQTVGNMPTLRATRRRQHADTSTDTTREGPSKRPWVAPMYGETLLPREPSERQQPTRAFLRAPKGTRRDKAEWLRGQLEAGVVTRETVASALEIQPAHVDEIALGKSELGIACWRKLAGLVEERLH